MAPRETENNAYAKFGVTNKEHYGMLWYFLEWSIGLSVQSNLSVINTGKLDCTDSKKERKIYHI